MWPGDGVTPYVIVGHLEYGNVLAAWLCCLVGGPENPLIESEAIKLI